jgi:hypothetical protein
VCARVIWFLSFDVKGGIHIEGVFEQAAVDIWPKAG